MTGQIVKILSNDYFVSSNDKIYICKSRGKFRNNKITPLVGDYCTFDKETNYILEIKERKNSLSRPSVANIDGALIVTSLKDPDFSDNLLDKLILVCEINNIKPIICITKKDLLEKKEFKNYKRVIDYYKKIGYKVYYNNQIRKIKKEFKNKTIVLTGQTGAGKTTLLNRIDRNLDFETGEISKALGRGKHTTRCTTLVNVCKGKILDTPGFSDIDLKTLNDEEIKKSFIEFDRYVCPFKDCMHINESDCEIKKHVGKDILQSRYNNYKKFLERK